MLSRQSVSKEELEKLRQKWVGADASKIEADNFTGLNFMVLVSRVSHARGRRFLKNDTYMFSTYEVAKACYDYFRARGGVNTLALVHVEEEFGYMNDPADSDYYE